MLERVLAINFTLYDDLPGKVIIKDTKLYAVGEIGIPATSDGAKPLDILKNSLRSFVQAMQITGVYLQKSKEQMPENERDALLLLKEELTPLNNHEEEDKEEEDEEDISEEVIRFYEIPAGRIDGLKD